MYGKHRQQSDISNAKMLAHVVLFTRPLTFKATEISCCNLVLALTGAKLLHDRLDCCL